MAPLVTASTAVLRPDPTRVIATFVRWGLAHLANERVIPCRRIVTRDGEADLAWWTTTTAASEAVNSFVCNVGVSEGVGRWHRSSQDINLSTIPERSPALGCGLTEDTITRFVKLGTGFIGIRALAGQESPNWGLIHGVLLPETTKITSHRPALVPVACNLEISLWKDNVISQMQMRTPIELPDDRDIPLFLRTKKGGNMAAIVAGHPGVGNLVLSPPTFSFNPDDLICDLIKIDPSHSFECHSSLTLAAARHPCPILPVAPRAAFIELDEGSLISSLAGFVPNLDYLCVND